MAYKLLHLMLALAALGLAAAAPTVKSGEGCTPFNPVSYNRHERMYRVKPFQFPATQRGFPPCAFDVKGFEGRSPDLAGHPIMTATCNDKIQFVLQPLANLSIVAPAKGEEHGVYVLHNVKDEKNPCPPAAECGTKAKDSVPCSKLGWGEQVMPIKLVDKTTAYVTKKLGSYVKFNRKSRSTKTTLFFGCPDFVNLGPTVQFSHCQIGQHIKVVVHHPPGGCK